jgi:hypothetical protein
MPTETCSVRSKSTAPPAAHIGPTAKATHPLGRLDACATPDVRHDEVGVGERVVAQAQFGHEHHAAERCIVAVAQREIGASAPLHPPPASSVPVSAPWKSVAAAAAIRVIYGRPPASKYSPTPMAPSGQRPGDACTRRRRPPLRRRPRERRCSVRAAVAVEVLLRPRTPDVLLGGRAEHRDVRVPLHERARHPGRGERMLRRDPSPTAGTPGLRARVTRTSAPS